MTADFTKLIDLAQPRLGAKVVYATDDFFADKTRLISPATPVFIPDKYDDNGKWMDGWESRRKRTSGHDYCIVKLGQPGRIAGFEIDTRHFTGNFPPAASVEACYCDAEKPLEDQQWTELVAHTDLNGDDQKFIAVENNQSWTHVRLHIYPDGGVARLRVYGEIDIDWSNVGDEEVIDLAAMEWGGRGLGANDEHFGCVANMIAPGKGVNMGDGWETRRRREPGHDWAVLKLGHPGVIEKIVVDTAYFKGNYPDRCFLQASGDELSDEDALAQAEGWSVLLPEQKLSADKEHVFSSDITAHAPVRFVRLNIIPDGGVSRLRLIGKVASN